MLMKCPECNLPVSDKALACPHCGYPIKQEYAKIIARRKPKHQRLPNGFGQISELKGLNLRKPFRAMVTVGKTDEGRPICKLLQPEAYFETYNDAYQALMEYHKDPYTMSNSMTVGELYEKWREKYLKNATESRTNANKIAWRYCDSVHDLKVVELRPRHIRFCMEEATQKIKGEEKTASPQIRSRIKTLFNQMLDYAVSYEIVDKNYSRSFRMESIDNEQETKHHIPYSDEEMALLWKNLGNINGIDVLLIQCYSGWRPRELEGLRIENINLEERTMVGGIKTKAGKNRIVPIHPRIYDLVKKRYDESVAAGSEYLFTTQAFYKSRNPKIRQYNYSDIKRDLKNIIAQLDLNTEHKAHDGRAHFITQAKKYNLDEYAIKYIVGHAITDITESVYTSRSSEWLLSEISKIP